VEAGNEEEGMMKIMTGAGEAVIATTEIEVAIGIAGSMTAEEVEEMTDDDMSSIDLVLVRVRVQVQVQVRINA
jgi:hypothetical protein